MLELQEVPGPHLVHARVEQPRPPGDVRGALLRGPGRIGWGDVEHVSDALLVRTGNVDVREVRAVVWGRLRDLRHFVAWDRDHILREDEGPQSRELLTRSHDGAALGLIGTHLLHAGLQVAFGQELRTGLFQRRGVTLEVGAADGEQLCQRQVDALGRLQHFQKQRLPECEATAALRLALEPGVE